MPLLQIKKHFQITLPARFRDILRLKVGDIVEADLQDNVIVLKPKVVLDKRVRSAKAAAWEKQLIQSHLEHPIEMSEEEVLQAAEKTREELFQEKYGHLTKDNK